MRIQHIIAPLIIWLAQKTSASFVAPLVHPLPTRSTTTSFVTRTSASTLYSYDQSETAAAVEGESTNKPTWHIFVDLQCPFAKKAWQRFPLLEERFGKDYDMSIELTSLVFHPQAFVGHQAAYLIEQHIGSKAKQDFVNTCFQHQGLYSRDTLGEDYRKSEVDTIFANLAERAGAFNNNSSGGGGGTATFTRDYFLQHLHDWDDVIKPTYGQVKRALNFGVFGTPKHVIDGQLVSDTESTWGPDEWEEKLQTLQDTLPINS